MTTFVNAVRNQETRTENGMKARASTANACTDLFFKIGAMRGQNVIPAFVAAYVENPDVAIRIALWARDIRGGAGERKLFRDILNYLATNKPLEAASVLKKVPELGRWDDLLEVENPDVRFIGYGMIKEALAQKNGLAAKWMPRKGELAADLRKYLGMTPKQYRKTLVELTKVVESQMCANDWDNINFSHVPSVASARYKKAFGRHTEKYGEYIQKLNKGDKTVKVNAGAVYPYDVLKGLCDYGWYHHYDKNNLDHIKHQWEALPNYMGDANVLPLVDVSGSMFCPAGKNANLTCVDVAVSLGLYCADKNKGKFADTFLTFSAKPQLVNLEGDILQKIEQMNNSAWGMNTNLVAAMDKILDVATKGNVPQEEMPQILLIMSDMQFDACARFDDSAMEMIRRKFSAAGYTVPQIVFWNLNAKDNVPVKYNEKGVALVSGFSPSIMKAVLAADMSDSTPEAIMLKTVMQDRYSW